MYFANKNLLYTFNQSLDTGFVTIASFKRYARSPENRTFKNYFRHTSPGDSFIPYLRKRAHYSLNRYISHYRRKQNPILNNFATRITNTIMEKLQQLSPCKGGVSRSDEGVLNPLCSPWQTKKTQNKPNLKHHESGASRFLNNTNAYCLTPVACKYKPKSKLFVGLARNFQQRSAKIKPATAEGAFAGFTHGSLRPFDYVPIRHPKQSHLSDDDKEACFFEGICNNKAKRTEMTKEKICLTFN